MKKIIVINPHSFVDVITNSSTELFVCPEQKSIESVKEIISEVMPKLSWYEVREPTERELFIANNINSFIKEKWNEWYDYYNYFLPKSLIKQWEKFWYKKDDWRIEVYINWYEKNITKTSIIIEWDWDNSLPYEYFDLIESTFNADRVHLW